MGSLHWVRPGSPAPIIERFVKAHTDQTARTGKRVRSSCVDRFAACDWPGTVQPSHPSFSADPKSRSPGSVAEVRDRTKPGGSGLELGNPSSVMMGIFLDKGGQCG